MRHDAIIIGGSFAGLSAATYLARGRRSVTIIDSGFPRNRFAAHSHGFLTHDGDTPTDMLSSAQAQVGAYPTVSFVNGSAIGATGSDDGFSVTLGTGEVLDSARLILAFGISDVLPDIPGLAERWGTSVLHCPYCHGYEFSDCRLGVLHLSPNSIHQAKLIAEWGPTTFFLDGATTLDDATLADLRRRDVALEPAPVRALHGAASSLSAVELADGRTIHVDALYIGAPTRLNSDIARQLGCGMEDGPVGKFITTDGNRMTTVPNVYAAGDITRGTHTIAWATADGVTAGMAVHRSLVF
jgi:thioredoxin reductase